MEGKAPKCHFGFSEVMSSASAAQKSTLCYLCFHESFSSDEPSLPQVLLCYSSALLWVPSTAASGG